MKLSEKVLRVLRGERISEEELATMLDRAAPTSLRGFNRRYFHWLFLVRGDLLEDMQYANVVEVGHGKSRMMEDHEACQSRGCRRCGWVGQIARRISDKEVPRYDPQVQYLRRRAS